ncbi:hypothetical protein H7R52_18735 [Weissella confusa]|uniref:Uncharacterized protein n=1 Tax=Weissella confusa TaxID=1583 RepID=A0A923NHF8_WEICO|nr:hypothetical protein [Weissella confusa]
MQSIKFVSGDLDGNLHESLKTFNLRLLKEYLKARNCREITQVEGVTFGVTISNVDSEELDTVQQSLDESDVIQNTSDLENNIREIWINALESRDKEGNLRIPNLTENGKKKNVELSTVIDVETEVMNELTEYFDGLVEQAQEGRVTKQRVEKDKLEIARIEKIRREENKMIDLIPSETKIILVTKYNGEKFVSHVNSLDALELLLNRGDEIYSVNNLHTKLYLFNSEVAIWGSAFVKKSGNFKGVEKL